MIGEILEAGLRAGIYGDGDTETICDYLGAAHPFGRAAEIYDASDNETLREQIEQRFHVTRLSRNLGKLEQYLRGVGPGTQAQLALRAYMPAPGCRQRSIDRLSDHAIAAYAATYWAQGTASERVIRRVTEPLTADQARWIEPVFATLDASRWGASYLEAAILHDDSGLLACEMDALWPGWRCWIMRITGEPSARTKALSAQKLPVALRAAAVRATEDPDILVWMGSWRSVALAEACLEITPASVRAATAETMLEEADGVLGDVASAWIDRRRLAEMVNAASVRSGSNLVRISEAAADTLARSIGGGQRLATFIAMAATFDGTIGEALACLDVVVAAP